ncbi:MAG: hypothetical protein ABI810_20045 [Sphingomonas bacterium]
MMKRIPASAATALCLAVGATSAQAAEVAQPPCVTHGEAVSLVLVLAPEAIKAAGTACAQVLPSTALIRQTTGPYIQAFQAEADRAWPQAKSGIGKLAAGSGKDGAESDKGKLIAAMLDSDQIRPMVIAMLAPELAKAIKPKDCATIDHMVTSLAPLPPANFADAIVTVIEMVDKGNIAKGKKRDLPICPVAGS